MCDDNRDTFIAKLHKILLAPDLCDRLFSITKLLNLEHTCLFYTGFLKVYFIDKEKNAVTLPHSSHRKHAFLVYIKKISKTKKLPSRKKIALELLHQRLGHISNIALMTGDTANVWKDIELIIYLDPFEHHARVLT